MFCDTSSETFVGNRLYCVTTNCGHIDWTRCHFTSYKSRKKMCIIRSLPTFRCHASCLNITAGFVL